MSGIGFWELIILSLIGLIVLGPERLPRLANQLGNWLGQARRMTRVMKRQLEDELNFENDLKIKPPNREPSSQAAYTPRNDDHFSEAHGKGEVGTGVGGNKTRADDGEPVAKSADLGDKETPDEDRPGITDAAEESATDKKAAKEAS